MDADLEAMRSIPRFRSCVDCLLGPLLLRRAIAPMPCKHHKTFEMASAAYREFYEQRGLDHIDDDDGPVEIPPRYCDCARFNRRNELWEVGELTTKFNLTRTQMRELAHVLMLGTHARFTYNQVKRTMFDMFRGVYVREIKALRALMRKGKKGKGEDGPIYDGKSFAEASAEIVAQWQFRMMPNA